MPSSLLEKYNVIAGHAARIGEKRALALDRVLYPLVAALATLIAARAFYGYMLLQTGGEWSAPLDDVFIHFDYARATARGYPFQWSMGNGYSSGNTSLLYPFVLAAGYKVGFRGASLMIWAGIVACVSIYALLLATARLFAPLPAWAKYVAPVALFSIGALDWSLFSGMEVALFLGIWSAAFRAALAPDPRGFRQWELGLWGLLLVVTRPEGATSIAALGLLAGHASRRAGGLRAGLATLARAGAPALLALIIQAIVNRLLTGEFAASGAIVKITLYNPFMTGREKLDEYLFLLKYVIFRNTEYHFSDPMPYGYIVPLLAAVPLAFAKTRHVAIALWGSILSWLAIVALNAQVRWQNERYTMPAVAWVILLAALGVALLLEPSDLSRPWSSRGAAYWARATAALALIVLFVVHQAPKMRDQIWFFGRASRNIRDQHVTAGRLLRQMTPRPKRVLVGDAGAILYASDLPGLDLIGLGGYNDLPFARAGLHGLGATLELIERIPAADRPDLFAIYPSWWGDLPTWFGRRLTEVPVRGNVICGGSEKVIYRADWHGLDNRKNPLSLGPGEEVVDEVDVADLVSEREHDYQFPHPSAGFVEAKVLADPSDARQDLFDAGRKIPQGRSEEFRVNLMPGKSTKLIARTAPEHDVEVRVAIRSGSTESAVGSWRFSNAEGWREASVALPVAPSSVTVVLTPISGDWVDHHVWAVQVP